jgi:hypothetical protein
MGLKVQGILNCDACEKEIKTEIYLVHGIMNNFKLPEGWTDGKYWQEIHNRRKAEKEAREAEIARKKAEKSGNTFIFLDPDAMKTNLTWGSVLTDDLNTKYPITEFYWCKECSEKRYNEMMSEDVISD